MCPRRGEPSLFFFIIAEKLALANGVVRRPGSENGKRMARSDWKLTRSDYP